MAISSQKNFLKSVLKIMLPILLQNVITNFVNLLDNVMIGQVGTEPMSGVAIANQLFFVFNLCVFGGLAGAGIYTAQYCGKGNDKGICHTVRMKIYLAVVITAICAGVLFLFGTPLVNAFLHEGNEGLSLQVTYNYAMQYMHIMMIQMPLFAFIQIYGTTLREAGETLIPMISSIAAVFVNLIGNYILIFGKFGAPKLGVAGAAIATVIARVVEMTIMVIYSHANARRFPFFAMIYKSFKVAPVVAVGIIKKGSMLLLNELLWSSGMTMLNQCYSLRGIEVVSATNIASTVGNLFMCALFSSGSTINIMVGQLLGAGKLDEAEKMAKKIRAMSVIMCIVVGGALCLSARPIAQFYNTTDTVKQMATYMMIVLACQMPFNAFTNACYFTLRSGGKVLITFIFDSTATWLGYVVVAFTLSRFTSLPIIPIYICVNAVELLKCIVGYFLVRSRKWIVNLVGGVDIT